jgi:spore germination protein GerM
MPANKKTVKKKNGASVGIAFWLIFTVVMCALFIINYPKIQQTWNRVFAKPNQSGELALSEEPAISGEDELLEAIAAAGEQPSPVPSPPPGAEQSAREGPQTDNTVPTSANTGTIPATGTQAAASGTAVRPVPPPSVQQSMRTRTLYFVRVDGTGMVFISAVKRQIAASGSPLNETLAALFAGPTAQEKRNDLTSLIPEGTRVLGVRVTGGTAYINFNERFLFNSFGAEGYIAQLRQIVWTATDSGNVGDNVQNVQILIDGRTVDYLGDNIPIGTPISRNSF